MIVTPEDVYTKLRDLRMEHVDDYSLQIIADDLSMFLEKRSLSTRVFIDPKTFWDTQEIRTKVGSSMNYKRFTYLFPIERGDHGAFERIVDNQKKP